MKRISAAFVLAVLAAAPISASEKADAMAIVNQFTESFNKGDEKGAVAACADQTSIIDEFAPHEWHGSGACAKWMADFDADAKKNGITDGHVTLSKPWHIDVTTDRAYIVVPVNYTFKQNGKAMKEIGSILTVALQKEQAGWRITGWAWSKH